MFVPVSQGDPFDELVDDFLARLRRGEHPSVDEYQERFPEFAEKIGDYFPALVVLEELGACSSSENTAVVEPVVPKKFGEFSIVREIGRGGMGIVYQAVQESLGREVALKILPDSVRFKGNARARFRREASAAARLHHTNIVPVFGFGEWQGVPYYAMQYIDGQNLDRVIVDVRQMTGRDATSEGADSAGTRWLPATEHLLTPAAAETIECRPSEETQTHTTSKKLYSKGEYYRQIAVLGIQAAGALAHAHANGILHRDIKPSNLLLDSKGTLWITDFGLAKGLEADGVTQTGELIGTLRYMAPERFRGGADSRSDIYALGTTLYELLALQPAFDEKDNPRLIAQILQQSPVRLRELDPQIPADMETIVEKAISPDPKDRYASGEALAEDLSRFLADRPILARKSNPSERLIRWSRRNRTLAAMICLTFLSLLAVAVGSLVSVFLLKHQLGLVDQAQQQQQVKLFEAKVEKARALAWSRRIGQHHESLQALREAMAIGSELSISAATKLDLRNLALAALVLPDVQQLGQSAKLPDGLHAETIQCSRDLEWYVAVNKQGAVSQYRTRDHNVMRRFLGIEPAERIVLSPDERILLVQHRDKSGMAMVSLYVLDAPGGESVTVRSATLPLGMPFSQDSRVALLPDLDGFLQSHETGSARLVNRHKLQVKPNAWVSSQPRTGLWIILAEDGSTLQMVSPECDLVIVEQKTPAPGRIGGLAWNDTGDLLVAEIGRWLYTWEVNGAVLRLMSATEKPQNDMVHSRFVPGTNLLCCSRWDGNCELWDPVVYRQLLRFSGSLLGLHRDGQHLLLRDQDVRTGLWLLHAGSDCLTLHHGLVGNRSETQGWAHNSSFSPDGAVLATVGVNVRFWDVARGTVLGTLPLGSCSGVFQPGAWRFVTSSAEGIQSWPIEPSNADSPPALRIGKPTRLGKGNGDAESVPQWSADGWYVCWIEANRAVVWDQAAMAEVKRFGPLRNLRFVTMSPGAELVALGPHTGPSAIKVWERSSGRLAFLFPCSGLGYPCFSPDGSWLYAEIFEGGVRRQFLWETREWKAVPVFNDSPHTAGVCFSPDSRMLARGAAPGVVQLRDVGTGAVLASLTTPFETHHYGMTFSPQSNYLAVTNMDHTFHLWNLGSLRRKVAELGLDW